MVDPEPASSLIDQVLADRYRIERLLGEGGMGEVYLARHVRTGRPLAVKLLVPEAAREPENLQRFEREARALGALGHPNIVGIHDFAETADGRPFLVMDYLEGEELAHRLERVGRLPWPEAARLFDQIASALHAAHQAGVLHRDLKPGNIFLARSAGAPERVVLLDFGLAKSVSAEEARVTRTGIIMGTPLYMSPEQARGGDLDVRSDVYSLAAMFFEMLAGRPPFEGSTWTAILTALLVEPPPLLSQSVPADLPGHLDQVLASALSKDPAFRPPDVASLAAAVLERRPDWANAPVHTPGSTARTVPTGVPATHVPMPGPDGEGARPAGARPLRRVALWIALGVLVLAGAVTGGVLIGSSSSSSDAAGTKAASGRHAHRYRRTRAVPRPAPVSPADAGVSALDLSPDGGASPPADAEVPAARRVSATHDAARVSGHRPASRPRRTEKRVAPRRPAMTPRESPRSRARISAREALLRSLPSNEQAMFKAMKKSDWSACIRASYQLPVTSRILQMRVSCGMSGHRPAVVRKACTIFQKRYASHPFAKACGSILRGLDAQRRAQMRP